MRSINRFYERDVQANTSNYDKSTNFKTKSPEAYEIYWWCVVNGKKC